MKDSRQTIIRPIVTEKSLDSQADHSYSFEVDKRANKIEIRKAIEDIFDVRVLSVRTMHKRGKLRRQRQQIGRRRSWKKAIIKLAPEDSIDVI